MYLGNKIQPTISSDIPAQAAQYPMPPGALTLAHRHTNDPPVGLPLRITPTQQQRWSGGVPGPITALTNMPVAPAGSKPTVITPTVLRPKVRPAAVMFPSSQRLLLPGVL